jgi:tetratricopeptide (TPR) repeat protein
MDEAVRLDPMLYLDNRGWCRFKFLHDYEGALQDLLEAQRIQRGHLGWSGDGDYDLNLMVALCYREQGHLDSALVLMDSYFTAKEENKTGLGVGIYDYLHYGVTLMKAEKFEMAMAAFQKQIHEYRQLPDTYYYIALLHEREGDAEKYYENVNLAHQYYVKGYNRKDPYCEALDEVYLSDIQAALQKKFKDLCYVPSDVPK